MGRFHGCWSHLCLSLFIPRGKRWKGGIPSAYHLLLLVLHPPWVNRCPVGIQQRPPGRMEKPVLQRPWPCLRALAEMGLSCLVGRFPEPTKDRAHRVSHLHGCSGTRPSSHPPSRRLAAPRGLCASVRPSNSSSLHSDPSQPKPITSLPRLRSLQQPRTQPTCP